MKIIKKIYYFKIKQLPYGVFAFIFTIFTWPIIPFLPNIRISYKPEYNILAYFIIMHLMNVWRLQDIGISALYSRLLSLIFTCSVVICLLYDNMPLKFINISLVAYLLFMFFLPIFPSDFKGFGLSCNDND